MARKKKEVSAAKVEQKPDQRHVPPARIEERLSQGWVRVEGAPALRNGSVLMEKKA